MSDNNTIIQYKYMDGSEDDWEVFTLAPDWTAMKTLADKWQFAIRQVDETGFVSREYYPMPETLREGSL